MKIFFSILLALLIYKANADCMDKQFDFSFQKITEDAHLDYKTKINLLDNLAKSTCNGMNKYQLYSYILDKSLYADMYDKAKEYADKFSEIELDKYKDNWNYNNILHNINTVYGIVSFNEDDIPTANEYLIKSIDIGSSPQLASFGPSFKLADMLLSAGQKEVVLSYLDKAALIWESGQDDLKTWKHQINVGEHPKYFKYGFAL